MAKKLCVVASDGVIPQLGNIRGPILRPTELDMAKVISMVNAGMLVYEVNPANHSERVRLNYSNLTSVNFYPKKKKEAPVTYNPYKSFPEGRRNTVVDKPNEAETVRLEKAAKKQKNTVPEENRVKSSDF